MTIAKVLVNNDVIAAVQLGRRIHCFTCQQSAWVASTKVTGSAQHDHGGSRTRIDDVVAHVGAVCTRVQIGRCVFRRRGKSRTSSNYRLSRDRINLSDSDHVRGGSKVGNKCTRTVGAKCCEVCSAQHIQTSLAGRQSRAAQRDLQCGVVRAVHQQRVVVGHVAIDQGMNDQRMTRAVFSEQQLVERYIVVDSVLDRLIDSQVSDCRVSHRACAGANIHRLHKPEEVHRERCVNGAHRSRGS